jgi:hypothetical protein
MSGLRINRAVAAGLLAVWGGCGSANAQQMKCETGPVLKTYGSTPWLAYSCDDGLSIAIVSAPGNPASPFYFFLHPNEGVYRIEGEGTGDKGVADRAIAELQGLSQREITGLIDETRKVQTSAKPN